VIPRTPGSAKNPGAGAAVSGAADVVSVRGLSAGYGARPGTGPGPGGNLILRDLSLTIKAGELTGLCGPNGTGKSTFVKLCLGILRPASGSIRVLGAEPWGREGRKLRLRIGYVPQRTQGGTLPVTVRDAVGMGLYGRLGFFRPLGRDQRLRVEGALESCGIAHLADKRVQELSGGQAQRTAIARALATEAELLFLDEPSSSLDAEGRTALLRVIQEQRDCRRMTVVMVSHDEDALGGCGAVYRFSEGRAIKLGG
jgi:ABC-type Mn2+/Zn2+ transport system ATPase subunit